ncbi:hypothetical protein SADUNF_Sadunf09G0005800 [Salix dunnii]|uniref:Uncharacterized protein n=1 Tax=Salix dunnii TaxID=1413687 RepID=A0A835MSQ0_9ROSI|nr:hypothetical protein SADUNF_Sadunf09G0005800 [Salix dunnii]
MQGILPMLWPLKQSTIDFLSVPDFYGWCSRKLFNLQQEMNEFHNKEQMLLLHQTSSYMCTTSSAVADLTKVFNYLPIRGLGKQCITLGACWDFQQAAAVLILHPRGSLPLRVSDPVEKLVTTK